MNEVKKIKIESHGISPWHFHLENMSWGFSRKQNNEDIMAYLNVDSNLVDGGRGLEDVLMADFLQSLSFMDAGFINTIIKKAKENNPEVKEKEIILTNPEIRGNAGNYYLPYEYVVDGVRVAQPDGWIADAKTLILLEAKGYRKTASLNKGQLVKEFLIAKNVAGNTGRGDNFFVMFIAPETDNVYKKGENKFGFASFENLWRENLIDFGASFKNELKLRTDFNEEYGKLKNNSLFRDIQSHFLWITWDGIEKCVPNGNHCASQIEKAIEFHKKAEDHLLDNDKKIENWPVFSKLLAKLASEQVPLYHFYNGGCGNEILQDFEEEYLSAIGFNGTNPWMKWHAIAKNENEEEKWKDLCKIEEERRNAAAALKSAQKKIREFYVNELQQTSRNTTRAAFNFLGESARLNNGFLFFEQRMKVLQGNDKNQQKNEV